MVPGYIPRKWRQEQPFSLQPELDPEADPNRLSELEEVEQQTSNVWFYAAGTIPQ
jgi:hypothetical protein